MKFTKEEIVLIKECLNLLDSDDTFYDVKNYLKIKTNELYKIRTSIKDKLNKK